MFDALKEHGFEDEQARAIVTVVTHTNDELATKKDIELLRAEIAKWRADTRAQNATFRAEMQAQNVALRAEMQASHTALRTEMQAKNTKSHANTTQSRANDNTLQHTFRTLYWMVGLLYPLLVGMIIAALFR